MPFCCGYIFSVRPCSWRGTEKLTLSTQMEIFSMRKKKDIAKSHFVKLCRYKWARKTFVDNRHSNCIIHTYVFTSLAGARKRQIWGMTSELNIANTNKQFAQKLAHYITVNLLAVPFFFFITALRLKSLCEWKTELCINVKRHLTICKIISYLCRSFKW